MEGKLREEVPNSDKTGDNRTSQDGQKLEVYSSWYIIHKHRPKNGSCNILSRYDKIHSLQIRKGNDVS